MATTTGNDLTIVSVFDSMDDAQDAIQDLVRAGIPREDISLAARDQRAGVDDGSTDAGDGKRTMDGTSIGENVAAGAGFGALGGLLLGLGALAIPGIGPIVAAGPLAATLGGAAVGAAGGGLIGALKDAGVPDEDVEYYQEHIRSGGVLVTVRTDASHQSEVVRILDRHDAELQDSGSVTGSTLTGSGRGQGSSAIDPLRTSTSSSAVSGTRGTGRSGSTAGRSEHEQSIPVVEEQLSVGKRAVERGRARVFTHVTERPVEEQVHLRDETIRVERRPVNQPADAATMQNAFREQTIEVREVTEEPVVQKTARVVEEVVVGRQVNERVETVRDTVRRTDVEVERGGGMGSRESNYDTDFENDFRTRYGSVRGAQYATYAPAYRYGFTMANDQRYRGRNWEDVEDTMRTDYLRNNPNSTWDNVKGAVRYGWEKVTGKR